MSLYEGVLCKDVGRLVYRIYLSRARRVVGVGAGIGVGDGIVVVAVDDAIIAIAAAAAAICAEIGAKAPATTPAAIVGIKGVIFCSAKLAPCTAIACA